MSLLSFRSISLLRPGRSTIIPTHADLISNNNSNTQQLFTKNSKFPIFETLGDPSTLASVTIPPSVSLYVRKGCLVSLYNSASLTQISMSDQWLNPWKKFLRYGSIKPSIYHKLISNDRFHCLISANFNCSKIGTFLGWPSTPFRTLSLLNLDGRTDWFVFGRDSIIAFEENLSLNITEATFWQKSRKFFKAILPKHSIVKGRGNVLLSGSGSIYTIQLNENEEIIIKSEHLLAANGISFSDIMKNIKNHPLISKNIKSPKLIEKNNTIGDFKNIQDIFFWSKTSCIILWNGIKAMYSNYMNGPSTYLKIKGPRTLIIQSSKNIYLPDTPLATQPIKKKLVSEVSLSSSTSSNNYLSYATVQNGEVIFKSTPDFRDTIEKLKALNK